MGGEGAVTKASSERHKSQTARMRSEGTVVDRTPVSTRRVALLPVSVVASRA